MPAEFLKGSAYISQLISIDCSTIFFQAKEEFGSTADIVQTIQTMTANLVKVIIVYIKGIYMYMYVYTNTIQSFF